MSASRKELIDRFLEQAPGLEKNFEARQFHGDWLMPYRLYKPSGGVLAPLILYLHGSGGTGDDNQKQLGLGNIFGTQIWVLQENQRRFPCYVVAPQSIKGWIRFKIPPGGGGPATIVPGLGFAV